MPKKKDGLLIAAVLVLALLLLIASRLMPKTDLSTKTADVTLAPDAVEYLEDTPAPQETAEEPAETEEPMATEEPAAAEEPAQTEEPVAAEEPAATEEPQQSAAAGPMPAPQTEEVKGYVVITVGNRQYGDPIPMDRDKVITIKQDDGKINKVHITPEKVYMESSTCENQDCVGQGEISLDNYKTRILSTYVICLPNAVTIELVPVE
ncbi:MAG: NusG domain II-containing protein [Clostridia bacterium]|nr:NusG domain II-containing protein [Clostridia bacterium]